MSSQTEEAGTATAEAVTPADELAALSIDQLKELLEQYDDPNTKAALQAVIAEREKLKAAGAEEKSTEKKSRKGSRAPKGRQVKAADSFNADPANLERLKAIMENGVVQADGTFKMTPELIQVGISAYYDERRREGGTTKKEAASTPIIPTAPADPPAASGGEDASAAPAAEAPAAEAPAPEEAAPAAEPTAEATATAADLSSSDPPVSEAEAALAAAAQSEGAEEAPADQPTEPQAQAGPPFNPYGTDEE